MRLGINLRGDLAKLDDVEIASRYEALVTGKEERIRKMLNVPGSKALHRFATSVFGRGLLHARMFYKMQAIGLVVCGVLNLPAPDIQDYLDECELKDVRDELRRRITQQKTALATT